MLNNNLLIILNVFKNFVFNKLIACDDRDLPLDKR